MMERIDTEKRNNEKAKVKWIRKEMKEYESRKSERINFYVKTMRWKDGLNELSK